MSDHIYKLLWKLVLSATYNFKTNPIKQLTLDFLAEVDKEELLKHLNKQFKSYTSIYFILTGRIWEMNEERKAGLNSWTSY